jgi:biotin carboxyl carrier protein
VPDAHGPEDRRAIRDVAERAADHAAIDRLTGDLLPALIAKLGATGLGEIEVREGAWRVRLRRPADGQVQRRTSGRTSDRAERSDRGDRQSKPAHHPTLDSVVAPGPNQAVATSPAVGTYQPRPDIAPGATVRAGDRLGAVEMLGIPHEVVAPSDGVVGARLVEPGDAVEYGQGLLVIEFAPDTSPTNGSGA